MIALDAGSSNGKRHPGRLLREHLGMDSSAHPDSPDPRELRVRELVARLYDGLADSHDEPMFDHMRRVAEGCEPQARVLGWLHDAVEDGLVSIDVLRKGIPLTAVESDALRLLTRGDSGDYAAYIERLATSEPPAGDLARQVKIADLHANLSRPPHPQRTNLERRYHEALRRLRG
jgi:hypothetical protein